MKYKIAAVILALGLSAGMSSYAMPKHRKHRGAPQAPHIASFLACAQAPKA